jgi:peroxiredoxin Q/BCP
VFGVSTDSADSHRRFKKKFSLPMTLLVDEDHAIAESYGVWVEKNTFGMKRMGVARTTFIVDPKGMIARVFEKVDPTGHGEEVAKAIADLRKGRGEVVDGHRK